MNKTILAVCSACVVASVAVALSASVKQTTPIKPQAGNDGASVTITGCLKLADTPALAAAKATDIKLPAAAAAAPKYVLANVERNDSKAPSSATDTVGTAGTTAAKPTDSAMRPAAYALVPDATVNLETHLNHQVEVTGTLNIAEPADRMTDSTMAQPERNPATIGTSGKLPTLKVHTLRMVAATCK